MITIPLLQLVLFGYAINTTPRNLPTAVLLQESSDVGRSILAAMQNTKFFKVTMLLHNDAELDQALASGKVLFAVEIPANFERALRRGDKPALLVAADATDPVATGTAVAALSRVGQHRARQRSRLARRRPAAVRDPHPSALQPGRRHRAQCRAGAARHHPDADHADLHGAVGDARDRARHHGEPARHADHAARDHARQDRALCAGRLPASGLDHRRRRLDVRRADRRQSGAARRARPRCSSPPICRSATRSRPWRRTSCKPCRCR